MLTRTSKGLRFRFSRRKLQADLKRFGMSEEEYGRFEAQQPVRGNYSHEEAATICQHVSNDYRRSWALVSSIVVDRFRIIDAFIEKKIPFVLTGMYGIASWLGQPRATHDVDFLCRGGRNWGRAVKVVSELYPELIKRDHSGTAAFYAPGEKTSLIDVTIPHRQDIAITLATAVWRVDTGRRYRIPRLEAALANKYGASVSLVRDVAKRKQDMIDFYNMVKHSMEFRRKSINLQLVGDIAETISKEKGRVEILRLIAEAKAGRVPDPNADISA